MQKISPFELTQNPFDLINRKWAMVTTRVGEVTNTMTASWGGVGVLWNKPVAYVFLRPQRYTRELMDKSECFSLCFLDEKWRAQMNRCGSTSGRDEDKFRACGFTAETMDGAPAIGEAELILTCKKLYRQKMTPESFLDPALIQKNYPNEDFHYMYVSEILGAYQK